MALTCTRHLHFDAAHRVRDHESSCKYVHGHRYVLEASFAAKELDALGRIIDFGVISRILGTWIDTHWDHTLVLWDKDRALGESVASHTGQVIYYLPCNPTAENMASYLFETIVPELFKDEDVTCTQIILRETPNCYATISA